MKRCKRCGVKKKVTEFQREPRVKDGLRALCRQCNNEKSAAWRKDNPDRWNEFLTNWRTENHDTLLQKQRDWRRDNLDRTHQYERKYRQTNKEKTRARQRRWVSENRARVTLYAEERRAREAGASGVTTSEQLQARIDFYGGQCWIPGCGVPYEAVDHTISLNQGGTNWPANLRPICKTHNSSKGDKHPLEFLRTCAARRA